MSVLSSISCVKSFFLTGVLPQSCFRRPDSVWQMASYVVCTPGRYGKCVCVCSTVASGVGHSLAFIILFHTLSGSPSLPLLLLLALILSFYFDLIILFNYFCFHLSLFLTIKSFPSTLSSFIQHYLKVASKDSPSLVATSLNKIIRISILIC